MEDISQPNESLRRFVDRIKVGPFKAYIWPHATDKGTFYGASIERRYRDADGNWQSQFMNVDFIELLLLAKLADLAHTAICKLFDDR